ncbi:MAG: RNA methyltransferase [Actinomycetota bacterium]
MRDRAHQFLVEGTNGIEEALAVGRRPELLFVTEPAPPSVAPLLQLAKGARVPVHFVTPAVMESISGTQTPPGAVAIVAFVDREPSALLAGPSQLLVVVSQVRDPGNLGTILRSAWAAGVDGVFLTEGTVDVYNPKVVRASAGAIFRVPVAREVEIPWVLSELGRRQIRRVAADPMAVTPYYEVDMAGPCALVFGNEAWGLPEEVLAAVDERASIPMRASAESLNVGVAAAVFLFEALRQRRQR